MSSKNNRRPNSNPAPRPQGRPQGATNAPAGQVVVVPQCPYCRSSDREKYRFVSCTAHGGYTAAGVEYSHVVRRRTKCLSCSKTRIDKFLENRAPEVNPGEENEPE